LNDVKHKVKAYAIVGVTGVKKVMATFLVRDAYWAKDKNDGIGWLLKQK
jgi:hypothetical protein